jgi:phosphoribosyl-ATP pyrophosphohydrolase/phosphoribosyl-AMP cyclohydrolase
MIPNFEKHELLPVIIQNSTTLQVLMLGFMNEEAYQKTVTERIVTFYSRSKQRLWTKGESSKNFLHVKEIYLDCDKDSILIMVQPDGPTCHKGSISCFKNDSSKGFLYRLEEIIESRLQSNDEKSYTVSLFNKGLNKIAQKVGEEAVELIIEAKDNNDELFLNEAADLLYHLSVLLKYKNISIRDIENVLQKRTTQ